MSTRQHTLLRRGFVGVAWLLSGVACANFKDDDATLSKQRAAGWRVGEHLPNASEASVVGAGSGPVRRGSLEFRELVQCRNADVIFKDEEGTRADRWMTKRLRGRLFNLAALVSTRFPGTKLRVTEAWDEDNEHGRSSLHYEGRAADITTSDMDPAKLGVLAELAVSAGFDWVFFEDATHVHVSVKR